MLQSFGLAIRLIQRNRENTYQKEFEEAIMPNQLGSRNFSSLGQLYAVIAGMRNVPKLAQTLKHVSNNAPTQMPAWFLALQVHAYSLGCHEFSLLFEKIT